MKKNIYIYYIIMTGGVLQVKSTGNIKVKTGGNILVKK
jgi:hypothetical protein